MASTRIALLCLAFLLVQSRATTVGSGRGLTAKEGEKAVAVATASAFSAGGTVTAHVRATSKALSSSTDAFAEAVAVSIAEIENGGDAAALAQADAEAYGKAVAKAYAGVTVDISSDSPTARACGRGFSSASSTATAFARAFVEVLADASDYISFASANGAAEAISVATAEAYADAEVAACTTGKGSVRAFQESLAIAITIPYARVTAEAYAAVAGKKKDAEIKVSAESGQLDKVFSSSSGSVDIKGSGSGTADGVSDAVTDSVEKECGSGFNFCCGRQRSRCNCRGGCRAELQESNGKTLVYVVTRASRFKFISDAEVGEKCFCPL